MDAVIMAGGEGTRLRPLTCDIPKPMARLCGRPVLEYIVELLAAAGVGRAAVTLRYLPEKVREHFETGSFAGVELSFFEEDEPLGTAGGVKNAARGLEGDIIVVSGDAMCDFDLRAAARFHKEKGAAATLVTAHVPDPREYGLVVSDASGRISGFVEKPGWAQSVTDAVNTGIYILSPQAVALIPDAQQFDFAKDLFPLMMSRGMKLFSFEAEGYWCDIGDIGAYTSCQFELLEGKCDCRLPGARKGELRYAQALPAGRYTLLPPVYIGNGVRIGDSAKIGPYAVLDDGCTIGAGATVKSSVVLGNAYVGERCELRGTLVCAGASLKKRAAMFEGSVAGSGSVIGADASVSPGVKIWPGKRIENGARAASNVKYGPARRGIIGDDGVTGEIGADMTPEICVKLGAAVGSAASSGAASSGVGVAHDGSNAASSMASAAGAGVLSSGSEYYELGSCPEMIFRFAVPFLGLKMGIYAKASSSSAAIKLIGGDGLSLKRAQERKIEIAVASGQTGSCPADSYGSPYVMEGIKAVYTSRLLSFAPTGLSGMGVRVSSADREIRHLLTGVLARLGCSGDGLRVHVAASGGAASFFDENGEYIDAPRTLALGSIVAFENGEDVALPFDAPRAMDALARRYGRRVLRYLGSPADSADSEARSLAANQTWVRDGLENAVRILAYLKKNSLALTDFSKRAPTISVAVRSVELRGNPGRLLRNISQGGMDCLHSPMEGVLIMKDAGSVLLSPMKSGAGLRILAEAADMEAAQELCAQAEKRVREDEILDIGRDNG